MAGEGTVLLAEDNRDDVMLMRCAFAQACFANPLEVVEDGKEVIDYLKGEGRFMNRAAFPFPALVLLDLRLPRIDGLEVLSWVRKQPHLQHLPVIVMTGTLNEELRQRAGELGANSCLVKPLGFWQLVATIQQQLQAWLGGGGLAEAA
jgi:CheY-like chemotaxis protein